MSIFKSSILFFVILFFCQVKAQDIYFFYTTGVYSGQNYLKPISFPYGTYDFSDVITWNINQATQIPIKNDLNNGFYPYPNDIYFFGNDMLIEFNTAKQEWQDNSPFRFFETYDPFGVVTVRWENNSTAFEDENAAGVTPIAVDQHKIVPVAYFGSDTQFDYTQVLFNNSSTKAFRWTTQYDDIPQYYLNQDEFLNFYNVALHELGHLQGLSHNSFTSSSIMDYPFKYDEIAQRVLVSSDIANIRTLAQINGLLTGIEDGIMITEDWDHYDINHLYVGSIHRTFIDEYPYGDYIVSWDNWKITASYGCGEVLLWNSQYSSFEIPDLPEGFLWQRDANGYVIGTLTTGGIDNDGIHHTSSIPIKINNVPNTFITQGTLTADTTYWCGDITLTGTVTVPLGLVLKVFPTSRIKFPTNASLIVYGKLDANDCNFTSQSGTSPDSWGSIILNGSGASGSKINYVSIQYGHEIQVINVPDFEISNSNFGDNYIAVYTSGSNGSILNNFITSSSIGHAIIMENSSTINCGNNIINKTNHSGVGILYGGGTSGTIWQNDITGCNWGIGAIWGASINSLNPSYPDRNNRIRDCSTGLMFYYNSYGLFGVTGGNPYGGNSIYNNSTNVAIGVSYPAYSGGLNAYGNWWGSNPPNTSLFTVIPVSYFYYDPYLTSDPWAGLAKVDKRITTTSVEKNFNISTNFTSSGKDSLLQGLELRLNKKYKEAKNLFISFITKHPDNQQAYIELYNCYNNETADDIINFFNSLPPKASKSHKLLLAYLYLKQGNIKESTF